MKNGITIFGLIIFVIGAVGATIFGIVAAFSVSFIGGMFAMIVAGGFITIFGLIIESVL